MTVQEEQPSSSGGKTRSRKPVANIINDAASAYREGTSEQIIRLIEDWEGDLNCEAGSMDIEMEDW